MRALEGYLSAAGWIIAWLYAFPGDVVTRKGAPGSKSFCLLLPGWAMPPAQKDSGESITNFLVRKGVSALAERGKEYCTVAGKRFFPGSFSHDRQSSQALLRAVPVSREPGGSFVDKRTMDISFTNAELYVLQTWCNVARELHECDPLHHPPVPLLLAPKLLLEASRPQRFGQEELVALEAILAAALD